MRYVLLDCYSRYCKLCWWYHHLHLPPIGKNKCEVENKLEIVSVKLFKWFHENSMKASQGKGHFLSSFDITTKLSLPDCSVDNSSSEKLLGVINDRNLNFNEHVTNLCAITQERKFKHSQNWKKTFNESSNFFLNFDTTL